MFTLNTRRTFKYPVQVTIFDGEKEVTGKFTGEFKVMPNTELSKPENEGKRLLDLVFVNAYDIEVAGDDGRPLQGEALLEALKADPATSNALISAYQESITKKNRPRI